MNEIFVTNPKGRLEPYFGSNAIRALQEFATVRLNPHDRELTATELALIARDSDAIISYRGTAGSDALFSALPRLKAFVRCAMDLRNIDVEAASRHGILVTRTGAGFVAAVAEWVLGVMIDLSHNISGYVQACQQGRVPTPVMGRELPGSVIGVIGYGQIGAEVCKLASAFGLRVLVADPHRVAGDRAIVQVDLPRLLQDSDYVVCLATATPETENLMDREAFASMRTGAFFINAARGNLVDECALLQELDGGRLAGCAIDVGRAADQMPSPDLARHPRVLATPHIGGLTRPATDYQALETVGQVAEILAGKLPVGALNAAHARRCVFDGRIDRTSP